MINTQAVFEVIEGIRARAVRAGHLLVLDDLLYGAECAIRRDDREAANAALDRSQECATFDRNLRRGQLCLEWLGEVRTALLPPAERAELDELANRLADDLAVTHGPVTPDERTTLVVALLES